LREEALVLLFGVKSKMLSLERKNALWSGGKTKFFSKIPRESQVRWPISHGGKFDMVGRF